MQTAENLRVDCIVAAEDTGPSSVAGSAVLRQRRRTLEPSPHLGDEQQ